MVRGVVPLAGSDAAHACSAGESAAAAAAAAPAAAGAPLPEDEEADAFQPVQCNVAFGSAHDGWAFRLDQFADMYAEKLQCK